MRISILFLLIFSMLSGSSFADDWDPKLAAKYLDERQRQWFEWPMTKAAGGPCVSCHTGLPYLLARPQLRKALGENNQTEFEKGLLDGLKARLASGESMFKAFKKEPLRSQGLCVEAVLSVIGLSFEDSGDDARRKASAAAAWDRLWSLENPPGARREKELWPWFSLELHPYESEASAYFGASLVAVAAGREFSSADQKSSQQLPSVTDYLHREFQSQPLHNRMMALWASTKLPGILQDAEREKLVQEVWQRQSADGGWSMEALGPWSDRPAKPESSGSNAYATALVTFILQQSGAACADARLEQARLWLKSHQNPQTGAWPAASMNKQFPASSMQISFMSDAATSFAVLGLLDSGAACKQDDTMRISRREHVH